MIKLKPSYIAVATLVVAGGCALIGDGIPQTGKVDLKCHGDVVRLDNDNNIIEASREPVKNARLTLHLKDGELVGWEAGVDDREFQPFRLQDSYLETSFKSVCKSTALNCKPTLNLIGNYISYSQFGDIPKLGVLSKDYLTFAGYRLGDKKYANSMTCVLDRVLERK